MKIYKKGRGNVSTARLNTHTHCLLTPLSVQALISSHYTLTSPSPLTTHSHHHISLHTHNTISSHYTLTSPSPLTTHSHHHLLSLHTHITISSHYTLTSPSPLTTHSHHHLLSLHTHITISSHYTLTSPSPLTTHSHHHLLSLHTHITISSHYTLTSPSPLTTHSHHHLLSLHTHITISSHYTLTSPSPLTTHSHHHLLSLSVLHTAILSDSIVPVCRRQPHFTHFTSQAAPTYPPPSLPTTHSLCPVVKSYITFSSVQDELVRAVMTTLYCVRWSTPLMTTEGVLRLSPSTVPLGHSTLGTLEAKQSWQWAGTRSPSHQGACLWRVYGETGSSRGPRTSCGRMGEGPCVHRSATTFTIHA